MIRLMMVLFLICSSSITFAMGSMPNAPENIQKGKPAAEFTLMTTADQSLSFSQAREGKKTVLVFWATWCPHCHEELETIRQKLDELNRSNIKVVLVDIGENKQDAKAYLTQQRIPLESFVDDDNVISGQYGVSGIPTLFFIDEKGIVLGSDFGFPADIKSVFNDK